jgi:hypothetical protein
VHDRIVARRGEKRSSVAAGSTPPGLKWRLCEPLGVFDRLRGVDEGILALSVVFGLASVPWTYAFVAGELVLWSAFVASATFYATDATGVRALSRGLASNLAGVAYAAGTLALVDAVGGGTLALSVVVGACMFLASLHAAVQPLSFTPGGFFGYATLFSVEAAGAGALGATGLVGATLATTLSMLLGAAIGLATEVASERLAGA